MACNALIQAMGSYLGFNTGFDQGLEIPDQLGKTPKCDSNDVKDLASVKVG